MEIRDLWFDYSAARSRFGETVRERKGQITSLAVFSVIIIIAAVFLLELPHGSNLANYLTNITAGVIGAAIAILLSKKSKQ